MKIGYQGVLHSHNHAAAIATIENLNVPIESVELVPLVSSKNVVDALLNKSIRYGVMAIRNSIGGRVEESEEALRNHDLEIVTEVIMPISHAAFKLNKQMKNDDIIEVISHPQALKQCALNLKRLFPKAVHTPIENTALAPKYVIEGKYNDKTAVVCAKVAGEHYAMTLVAADIQDNADNQTTFSMFQLPIEK